MAIKDILVANWREAWRWWSVRITGALAALGPVWLALPPEVKADMPTWLLPYVSPLVLVSIIVARVIQQAPRQ